MRLWNATTGHEKITLTVSEHTNWVESVAFSPDGRTLVGGSPYNKMLLWVVATGQEIGTLTGHTWYLVTLAFSPDGMTLASGSYDGTILLWDMSPYVTTQPLASDFDGDGTVGFPDFLQFAAQVGLSQGDAGYDARFDLNGDGTVEFGDFVIFARSFGQGS